MKNFDRDSEDEYYRYYYYNIGLILLDFYCERDGSFLFTGITIRGGFSSVNNLLDQNEYLVYKIYIFFGSIRRKNRMNELLLTNQKGKKNNIISELSLRQGGTNYLVPLYADLH